MKILFSIALLVFSWILEIHGQSNSSPVRLAIVVEDAALLATGDLLTVELSKRNDLQLLERAGIEKVYREQGLSSGNQDFLKLGQILGADGLLALQPVTVGTNRYISAQLVAVRVQAQLQVVPERRPQAVFGGMNQTITVQFRNVGVQSLESDLRMVLLQTSTATAARSGEWSWKKLLVLPGQTVLEKATVPFPSVRAETQFLLQLHAGGSNVIGQTKVLVYPTNLLAQLKALAGDEPLGVFDPADALKPLLRTQAVEYQDLLEDGTDKFRGQLAIFGPFEARSQMRASLKEDVRALAKRGVAVVWLLPPPKKPAPLKPSFYAVREAEGAVVVAEHDLVAQLAERPEAQLNLLRLAGEALRPTTMNLPETETSN